MTQTNRVWSDYQTSIFTWVAEGTGNLIVDAVAGSGKTTTIIEALSHIPRGDSLIGPSVLFLAFNKSIAETLQSRVPRGVTCKTFHALGLAALSGSLPKRPKVDGRKLYNLSWELGMGDSPDIKGILKLVSLLKSIPPGERSEHENTCKSFILQHNIDLEDEKGSIQKTVRLFLASIQDTSVIDFDDMLFLPLALGCPFPKYDWVFVDEAQDTNDIQLEILERLAKPAHVGPKFPSNVIWEEQPKVEYPATRYCFVGDPHQAIYGFRGANSDSMERIRPRFGCATLPLSVSYRCPVAVVNEANRILELKNKLVPVK